MKTKRHELILKLIQENTITTQEELLFLLRSNGFDVTQATVSRDIKELNLIKLPVKNGRSKYSANHKQADDHSSKFYSIFSQSVMSVDFAGNTSVIKCYSGTANAAAAAIDSMHMPQIVGTLAGDDTIFVLCRTQQDTEDFKNQIEKMLGGD